MNDLIVIGAGLTGATISRIFAEKGVRVHIFERRNEVGGNIFDYRDENGFLIQKYGPHTFHTDDEEVYSFISRFAEWIPFKLECGAEINGKVSPSPFNFKTVDMYFDVNKANKIKQALLQHYPNRFSVPILELMQSGNSDVRQYAEFLFNNDFRLYTSKQWGIPPEDIDPSVLKRVPIYLSYEEGYFTDKYQCVPSTSFTDFARNMLSHPLININYGVDALNILSLSGGGIVSCKGFKGIVPVIYTGALDELFSCRYGRLPYRGVLFEYKTVQTDSFQQYPIVALPQIDKYTRVTEFKKLYPQTIKKNIGKSVIAYEYSFAYCGENGTEPYYPVINDENNSTYRRYKELANQYKNLYVCGRLGDYKYYNMDQALRHAIDFCNIIESF